MNEQQIATRLSELQKTIDELKAGVKKLESKEEHTWTPFEINGKKYEISEDLGDMAWDEAQNKCKKLGGELPPRWVLSFVHDELPELAEGFVFVFYWSSTEYSVTNAWYQNFSTGGQHYYNKSNAYSVRCVRERK